jgi:hypothetical protein
MAMLRIQLTAVRKGLRKLIRELTDPYRPELHYMRGPGPKCQEKSSRLTDPAKPSGSAGPVLHSPSSS